MEKNAVIQVKSFSDLDESNAIEVITPGKFTVKDNSYEVVYEESEISGMKGTTTTLKIEEGRFILERVGTTCTTMEFKIGEMGLSLYNTPYGMLHLHIDTKILDINIDENGGFIYAKYLLGAEGQPPITTDIKVKIKVQ